jgi:hypothetical protein
MFLIESDKVVVMGLLAPRQLYEEINSLKEQFREFNSRYNEINTKLDTILQILQQNNHQFVNKEQES